MSSATVRISPLTRENLRGLSHRTGKSMQRVIEEAIELYRRRLFLEQINDAYALLRQEPNAWAEIAEERAEWDATLADGLDEAY